MSLDKKNPEASASKDIKLDTQPTAPVSQPSLRTRLEEAMKDGKMTSEELRNIATELDASREQTAMELKNLKAVVGDFGLRILREYTVKDQGDVDKLASLLKALKKADIIKDDITIEKLPADGTGMKLHYDEKEKKMRAIGLFERIGQDADEANVTVTNLLRLRFANAVPKDDASRAETKALIANLKEIESSVRDSNQIRGVNDVLKQAFEKNPIPENIRISRMNELPALIAFLDEFMNRKEEPKTATATPAPATAPAVVPVKPAAKPADAIPVAQPKPEAKEKLNDVSAFVTALSNGTEAGRITKQVRNHAKTDIESALSKATIDEATMKLLSMPLGDREKNRAFQDAIGMKQPNDGYVGYLTINALMTKVGSKFQLPENHFKKEAPVITETKDEAPAVKTDAKVEVKAPTQEEKSAQSLFVLSPKEGATIMSRDVPPITFKFDQGFYVYSTKT